MSYKLDLDTGYIPRHGVTEPDEAPLPAPVPRPEPVEWPAWANEHARPIPLVGEAPTRPIPYPAHLTRTHHSVATGTCLEALREPKPTLLGQCLHALRIRWPR